MHDMWSLDYARTVPGAMVNAAGDVFYPDGPDDAAWFAEEHGAWVITGADTGPVWDGEGTDPWIVPRMEAATEAAVIEAAIREALWVELSAWLVTVSRAVLHTVLPDPLAIFAKAPAWSAAVDRIVRGPVRDAVGTTYHTLLGDGYRFGSRPAVVEHLATVSNRMVRTVDSTFDLVARQVSIGANLGEGAAEIADRVDEVLSTTRTERWPNRATVVARTECLLGDSVVASDGIEAVYRRWYDGPIFRVHTASGQQFSGTANHPILTSRGWVGFEHLVPGDELVHNSLIQCVRMATDEHISDVPSSISQIYDALAAIGIVVRAETGKPDFHGDGMNGYVDIATTNRVLADRIISTGAERFENLVLEPSDTNDVLLSRLSDFLTVGRPSGSSHNSKWSEASLDRVLRHAILACEVRGARPGEVFGCQRVNVDFYPSRSVFSAKVELGGLRLLHSSCIDTSSCQDPFYDIGVGVVRGCQLAKTLPSLVCGHDKRGVDVISSRHGSGLMLGQRRYPGVGQYGSDSSGMDAIRLLNSVDAASRPVGVDNVVGVDVIPFSGHVYNLTTRRGWFNYGPLYSGNTMGALNAGRQDAFAAVAEELATPFEQMWVATVDRRIRPTHRRADGQRVPTGQPFIVGGASLRFPGDPLGPGKEVIQCLPGDVVVDYRAVRSVTRRWYEGDIVVIRFAGGNNLTITPNHPVLRADGVWVAAGLINEGDHCVRCDIRRGDSGTPDEDCGPSKIGEIYGTACEAKTPDRISLSPPDFHGDSTDGDVEVVPIYGNLRFDGYPARDEEIDEFGLSLADFACSRGRRADGRTFTVGVPLREVDVQPPSFGVRWCREETSGFDAGATHSDLVGFAYGSGVQPGCCESTDDGWPAHSKRFGDREDAVSVVVSGDDVVNVDVDSFGESGRFGRGSDSGAAGPEVFGDGVRGAIQESCEFDGARPVFVSTSEVVSVDRFSFAGHVFNLDTGVGWYTANCVPVRNCRCTTILLEPGETVDLTHRQFKNY